MWSASAQGNHRIRITSVMESQYVAFHISRKPTGSNNHVVKETERSASGCHGHGSRIGWAVGAICMFSVGVNVVLLMMYIGLQKEVDRQKGVVDNINTFLTSQDARDSSRQDQSLGQPSQEAYEKLHVFKRSYGTQRTGNRENRRNRRNARHTRRCSCNMAVIRRSLENNPPAFQYPPRPAVHLKGVSPARNGSAHHGQIHEFIQWVRPMPATNSFEVRPSQNHNVEGLFIKYSGTYFIYSQVALNGKTIENTALPECGHEIIRERPTEDTPFLLLVRSVATQDREGSFYPRSNVEGGRVYPLDTQLQAGLFELRRGDVLKVRVSHYCKRYSRVRMNEEFTYFGAFMVNDSPM
ncbi:uncharacterized protein [Haliotis cracherodii]|uniref:uncharacterized protein n=1 Tax=Haliotis cracherodii TaxID=6455 RepID=UPI0039E88F8B